MLVGTFIYPNSSRNTQEMCSLLKKYTLQSNQCAGIAELATLNEKQYWQKFGVSHRMSRIQAIFVQKVHGKHYFIWLFPFKKTNI